MPSAPKKLWQPTTEFKSATNLHHYMVWLVENKALHFEDYDELWKWSVRDNQAFWESIWDYFEVQSHSPYEYVHDSAPMPDTKWFEGSTLNYAEHIFSQKTDEWPAIIYKAEDQPIRTIDWAELERKVGAFASWLQAAGIKRGDRVVAYLPNIPQATIAFLATCSLGAIWSSCSPDFGSTSVVDRFRQIEPKVLLTVGGYQYGGKFYDKSEVVQEIIDKLPTLERIVVVKGPEGSVADFGPKSVDWESTVKQEQRSLHFEAVPFGHPIWILYSSGTTGLPKSITHSHGGVLLEHLKYLSFHNDVHPGERFFWYTTTGWMMWNFVQAALLIGATIVLYDGSPAYPNLSALWEFAETARIDHFGTSAPFLVANMKRGLSPGKTHELTHLRSLSSTGAPLPPEAFDWVYEKVKQDLWLCSMSGGTDVCTAFVGGMPLASVYRGEIQRRALGCAMYAFDDAGEPVVGEVGEMVITEPMPSMPIFFWNDPGKKRYLESYFELYPGIWRH